MDAWKKVGTPAGQQVLQALRDALPVLIEVRFQRAGTSSDWHVCSTDEELDELLGRIAPDHRLLAVSVGKLSQEGWSQFLT
jgi:hypothetical protein